MSAAPTDHLRDTRASGACTLCRQRKLRCDAGRDMSRPCTRCTRAGVACVYSAEYKRGKARSKAEMQAEIDWLRSRNSSSGYQAAAAAPEPPADETRSEHPPPSPSPPPADTSLQVGISDAAPLAASHLTPSRPTLDVASADAIARSASQPSARSLGGITIDGFKVDDCFALFFHHYHSMMPILDPSCLPDPMYKWSPFVFWCVLITGARRYEIDPTILGRLAPHLAHLQWTALSQPASSLAAILGTAILCTWPLPMANMWHDPSPMCAGATMQLALQYGLHMINQKQASGRTLGSKPTPQESSLARTWAYLEFVCHCTSWTTGLPPHNLTDQFDLEPSGNSLDTRSLPHSVYWMQKFDKFVVSAVTCLVDMTAASGNDTTFCGLGALIAHLDREALEISRQASADAFPNPREAQQTQSSKFTAVPNPLIVTIVRLYINAFHFLASTSPSSLRELIPLFSLACQWVDQAYEMDRSTGWVLYSSEAYFRLMTLVACIIMRISHSNQLTSSIDLRRAERSFFIVINLLKRRSLQSGDVNAETANILSHLWHSRAYCLLPDGLCDSLRVHSVDRGVMSIVYDCLSSSSSFAQPFARDQLHGKMPQDSAASASTSDLRMVETDSTHIFPTTDDTFLNLTESLALDLLPADLGVDADNLFWA